MCLKYVELYTCTHYFNNIKSRTHNRQKCATERERHKCTLIAPQLNWVTDDMWRRRRRSEKCARGKSHEDDTTLRRSSRWRRRQRSFGVLAPWSGPVECGRPRRLDEVAAGPIAGSGGDDRQCCHYADVERPRIVVATARNHDLPRKACRPDHNIIMIATAANTTTTITCWRVVFIVIIIICNML